MFKHFKQKLLQFLCIGLTKIINNSIISISHKIKELKIILGTYKVKIKLTNNIMSVWKEPLRSTPWATLVTFSLCSHLIFPTRIQAHGQTIIKQLYENN